MIELIVYNFLTQKMQVPVYMERPIKDTPERFVLIDHTGDSTAEHIRRATVAVQCICPSMYEAAEMAELVRDYMLYDFLGLPEVCAVELNSGPYNFTYNTQAESAKEYRYQAVFEIVYY